MEAASGAQEGPIVSVVIDSAETPESSESRSDGVRQQVAKVSPPTAVESSQEDLPGDSIHDHPPPPAREQFVSKEVEEATGQNQNPSSVVGERDKPALNDQDVEKGLAKNKAVLGKDSEPTPSYHQQDSSEESQCRVCYMSTETSDAINLGCNCKLDLGRVHKGCAEKWFKIRGNRTCEICGEIAQNVQLGGDSACQGDNQGIATVNNLQQSGRVARVLFVRSVGICLLWAAIIIFLYKYLLPVIRNIHNRSGGAS